ncbi:MAG: hypothetical protein ABJ360_25675 [Roseobacter sp.]|uniref:hypothetical protein n=1 Tax=Roseibium sp. TaxID=1936156 RepID=UPI0032669111
MANTFNIRRLDDKALYDLLTKAGKAATEASEDEALSGNAVTTEVTASGNNLVGQASFEEYGAEAGKYTLINASLRLSSGSNSKAFSIRRSSEGGFDVLTPPVQQNSGGANDAIWRDGKPRAALVAADRVISQTLAPIESDPDTPIGQMTNFAQNMDASLRGFTQELGSALQTLADQRALEQEHNDAERKRLREEMSKERDQVLEKARAEIAEQSAGLDKRKENLDAREQDLEIKSYKDARRKLFNQLLEDLQDGNRIPSASFGIKLSRIGMFLTLVVVGGVAASFALSSMTPDDLPESATTFQIWTVILKPVLFTVLSLGAFATAVQWLRHFQTRDLAAAEDVQRFGHDMTRASWVMEAYLEMTKEHSIAEPPESWMHNTTEGLFRGSRTNHATDDASQALAALLGMSASLRVGPEGMETTIGRKGLKKMAGAKPTSDGE